MYASKYKGVWFVEGEVEGARLLEAVNVTLNGVFSQSQLKTLDDVKDKMVSMAQSKKANAVVSFKYGQRSTFWRSLIGLDDVHWFGCGVLAIIPEPAAK